MNLRLRTIIIMLVIAVTGFTASRAEAKSIKLEWKEIKGAVQYEIRVEKSGKVIVHKIVEDTAWKGELPGGVYAWQIRAYDRTRRPGTWSEARPIVVMAQAPEPISPKDGAENILYNPHAGTVFKWKAVAGISKYAFILKNGAKTVLKKDVTGLEVEVPALPAGKYTWAVQSIMEPGERAPASFSNKRWESESDEKQELTIALQKLQAPVPIFPMGILPPPADKKIRFTWKPVEGARYYQVTLSKRPDGRKPASTPTAQTYRAETNAVDIPMSEAPLKGDYDWQVAAIANPDSKVGAPSVSPQSRAAFRLDQNAAFVDGGGYVAFSTMYAPYTYQAVSPSNNTTGKVSSTAATARVSGEYWFRPKWAVAAGVDGTVFSINNVVYNRVSAELQAKYRAQLSQGRYSWSLSPKAGVEGRQYFMLTSSPATAVGGARTSSSLNLMALGPDVGFDLRKQFSERWSVGVKVSFFIPMQLSGGPAGTQISGDSSYRNLSVGGQGLCWLNRRWGLGLGAFVDQRSISYTTAKSPLSEKISMDGTYFFGSLVYSFGK